MKNKYSLQVSCFFLLITFSLTVAAQFRYISPMPGSKYHNPRTTIILSNGDFLDESSVQDKNLVEIYGSKSGKHDWTPVLSGSKTLIIKPNPIFSWGETVNVIIHPLLRKQDGSTIEGTSFSFTIRNEITPAEAACYHDDDFPSAGAETGYGPGSTRDDCHLDSLPTYVIDVNNNPVPGQVFYNNQSDDHSDTNSFPTIINSDGSLVWACDFDPNGHDFKINHTGYMTFFNYQTNKWMVMDSNLVIFDSLQCGNGYEDGTNGHDIQMYPDGYSLLIAYDPETIDMSQVITGGQPDAIVKGLIIQELDINKEVIFQWRSWDYFLITDANNTEKLNAAIVDPIHGNAVERDNDGNLLLSSRNMSEITKINLQTGDIMWRLNGKNNQFTFVGDNIPEHFNYQHDIRRIANGNITLFNNGDHLPVEQSSAKEYKLDEVNKVATLVWYYEHPLVSGHYVFGTGSGSVERLADGSTLISWGKTNNTNQFQPNFTEIDPNKNITWEFTFDDSLQRGYRVHKYVWNPCAPVNPSKIKVTKITNSSAVTSWKAVHNAVSYDVQFRKLGKINWKSKNTTHTSVKLQNLAASTTYEYQVRARCQNTYSSDWSPIKNFTTAPLRMSAERGITAFNLYPNPSSGMVNITFQSGADQTAFISIYDPAGRIVYNAPFTFPQGEVTIPIDVSFLLPGFYITSVKTDDEQLVGKFLKQ